MNKTPSLAAIALCALVAIVSTAPATAPRLLFDFREDADAKPWTVRDDVVMGGRSEGGFSLKPGGPAVFSGRVSLENDGGFSSVKADFEPIDVSAFTTAKLRVKGDGKNYRFIVEADPRERVYYVHEFSTGTDWQTISVPLRSMYPMRRGDRLNQPDYPGKTLSQVRLMIANGKAESFRLEIEKIWLE
jgi:NADH dehydrogenase [ubiquinone] 1 alpha subcomplex assembly factor 1